MVGHRRRLGGRRPLLAILPTTFRLGTHDPATGTVIERRHELYGACFTGKVLVFSRAKGSPGWSNFFQATRLMGTAPLATVFTHLTTKAALGAIVTRVPTVTEFDDDPVAGIATGDRVEVDADHGLVVVHGPRSRPGRPR
ncbi:aconitase X swivel domain-containing protein [Streptomyces spiralis]|uniref:aconitase X swivel domain-containing protein n=1 Tax=Streptomyces spiralis TaxID=66376 RepID=UPI0036C5DB84